LLITVDVPAGGGGMIDIVSDSTASFDSTSHRLC
jgi:hypothetical protein